MAVPRALELTGIRILRTNWDSALLRSLEPQKNLNFKNPHSEVTVLWLAVKRDPIYLTHSINTVKDWVKKITHLYRYLSLQYCYDLNGFYNLDLSLPASGRFVAAKEWAHLFVHVSLIHAHFTAARVISDMFEDRVFYNPANRHEICVVYNYPTRVGELGTYLEHVQNFMQSLVVGRPDQDFLNWIEGHRYIYDQRAESKYQLSQTQTQAAS